MMAPTSARLGKRTSINAQPAHQYEDELPPQRNNYYGESSIAQRRMRPGTEQPQYGQPMKGGRFVNNVRETGNFGNGSLYRKQSSVDRSNYHLANFGSDGKYSFTTNASSQRNANANGFTPRNNMSMQNARNPLF